MKGFSNCNNYKLISGQLYFDDMTPVVNALVVMKVIAGNRKCYKCSKMNSYYVYTTTNRDGEYFFKIYNKNCYYRIKFFN